VADVLNSSEPWGAPGAPEITRRVDDAVGVHRLASADQREPANSPHAVAGEVKGHSAPAAQARTSVVTETTHDAPVTELGQHPRRRQESMSSSSNTGHVAVVTGASSEIGATTARALTAGGYRVALLARRADRSRVLAEELSGSAIAIEADVPDCDLLVAVAQRVQEGLGGADVLVDNAGGMLLGRSFPSSVRWVELICVAR
jgi:NADPH:quinone reductase-like Zn-dependent oxidoreductase